MPIDTRLSVWLRGLGSVAVIAGLLWWAGVEDVAAQLASASFAGILVVLLLHTGDRLLMAYKWWRLLRARGFEVGLEDAIRGYYVSSFVGAVVPLAGAQDLIRIGAMRDRGAPTQTLIASVALERVLGAASHGLYCLGALGLVVAMSVDLTVTTRDLAIAGVLVIVGLILLVPASFELARRLAAAFAEAPGLRGKLAGLAADYGAWRGHPAELGIFLVLTMIEGLFPIMTYWAAAWALGLPTPLLTMAIAVPLAFLFARLPIPLPSFGTEQTAFAVAASMLGMQPEAATAVTLFFLAMLLLALLPGAVAWFGAGRPSD